MSKSDYGKSEKQRFKFGLTGPEIKLVRPPVWLGADVRRSSSSLELQLGSPSLLALIYHPAVPVPLF